MSFDGSSLIDCGLPVVTLPFCCLVPEWWVFDERCRRSSKLIPDNACCSDN